MSSGINKIFIIILCSFLMAFSWGSNKPNKSELRNALSQDLPGFVKVTTFSIEAMQNFGNDVDPRYGSRFKAMVEASASLYKIDNKENKITFVRLITPKGKRTDIFGKTISILYQGAWKHDINIDGNPIRSLGLPLTHFTDGRVIVRGSKEANNYYSEIKRREAQRRANMANANNLIVGSWRINSSGSAKWNGDNTVYKLNGEGVYIEKNGKQFPFTWAINGDILIRKYERHTSPKTSEVFLQSA